MLELDFENKVNIYNTIKNYDKKIYIWGLGSVAAGVKRRLESKEINVAGFFTNVENYNVDARIGNANIFYLDDLLKKGEKFSIIVGHSHYEYAKQLKKYKEIENIWFLSMVARTDITMDSKFIQDNLDAFNDTYNKLSDVKSKKNLEDYLNVQLTQDGKYIVNHFDKGCSYFENDVFKLSDDEVYFDIGTYDGTSIDNFIKSVKGNYKKIIGLEVLDNVYKELIKKYDDKRIELLNLGVSDHFGFDYFNIDNQSTCLTEKKDGVKIKVDTIDNVCERLNTYPTLIKMCIGNSILSILDGSKNTLNKLPKLVITVGIDKEALTKYIQKINDIVGIDKYNYYLRYTSAMAECLILIAIPK